MGLTFDPRTREPSVVALGFLMRCCGLGVIGLTNTHYPNSRKAKKATNETMMPTTSTMQNVIIAPSPRSAFTSQGAVFLGGLGVSIAPSYTKYPAISSVVLATHPLCHLFG